MIAIATSVGFAVASCLRWWEHTEGWWERKREVEQASVMRIVFEAGRTDSRR